MKSRTTRRYRQLIAALPSHIRQQARQAYRLFAQSPYHPSLRFKQVRSGPPTYSVRIGLNYRTLGIWEGDEIVWFWVGTDAEYDAQIGRK